MKTIPLTQGKFALVDNQDFTKLSRYKWCAARRRGTFYAERYIRVSDTEKILISMHRVVLNPAPNKKVDHKDGNGLNNTRDNLRVATEAQNKRNQKKYKNNTSGYKGVTFSRNNRGSKKWTARVQLDGKSHFLGHFVTPEEAYSAYCAGAVRLHGEFARFA